MYYFYHQIKSYVYELLNSFVVIKPFGTFHKKCDLSTLKEFQPNNSSKYLERLYV